MARNSEAAKRYAETDTLMQRIRRALSTQTCPVCLQPNTNGKGITCGANHCRVTWLTGSPPEPATEDEEPAHA